MSNIAITRPDALRSTLVASHPRSGTHLLLDLLRRQFASCRTWRLWGLPLDYLYLTVERLSADDRRFDDKLALEILSRPKRALLKTHFSADWSSSWLESESRRPTGKWRELLECSHKVYIVRHPLDVMASYKQFLSSIDHSVCCLDFMSFIFSPHWDITTDRLGWWSQHVQNWAEVPGILIVRYEDVLRNTLSVLEGIAILLEEKPCGRSPILPPKVTSVSQTRLDRILKLSPASTAIVAERVRFPAHDWRRNMTATDRARISEQIGPLLMRFGYSLDPMND